MTLKIVREVLLEVREASLLYFKPGNPGIRIHQRRIEHDRAVRWKLDLEADDVFDIRPKHAHPIRQSIARDAAQGNELVNAWTEVPLSEVIVEIVGNKIWRRTAVQHLRPLTYMGEGKASKREDGSDTLPDIRVGLRFLPVAS